MSMRFALHRGMMAVSICRWESLQPLLVIGSRDICRGKIHSLTPRWYTTTSLPLATRSHLRHRWISYTDLIMKSTNLIRWFGGQVTPAAFLSRGDLADLITQRK